MKARYPILILLLLALGACVPIQRPAVWTFAAPYDQVFDALRSSVAATTVTRSFLGLQASYTYPILSLSRTEGILSAGGESSVDHEDYQLDALGKPYRRIWSERVTYGVQYVVRKVDNATEVTAQVYGDTNNDISSEFMRLSLERVAKQFKVVQTP